MFSFNFFLQSIQQFSYITRAPFKLAKELFSLSGLVCLSCTRHWSILTGVGKMLQHGICIFSLQFCCSSFCLNLRLLFATGKNFAFGSESSVRWCRFKSLWHFVPSLCKSLEFIVVNYHCNCRTRSAFLAKQGLLSWEHVVYSFLTISLWRKFQSSSQRGEIQICKTDATSM